MCVWCCFLAALTLGAIGNDVPLITQTFFATFSNEKFVVPICSAMGFAYVLKYTGCDEHLIRLLLEPVRRVKFLMVPGVVLVGFIVNIPVISQTSTAVCLGTVVVPLMRAAGFTPITIASALVLGCSVGGELLNPGAPELLTISDTVYKETEERISTRSMVAEILPVVLPVLGVSMLLHWVLCARASRGSNSSGSSQHAAPASETNPTTHVPGSPLNLLRALVPLVPLALLFTSGPPFNLFSIPSEWVSDNGDKVSSRLIGLAMLIGVGVAALAVPTRAKGCMRSFFEGAGYGFTTIISLIVTANCFRQRDRGSRLGGTPRHPHRELTATAPSIGRDCADSVWLRLRLRHGEYAKSLSILLRTDGGTQCRPRACRSDGLRRLRDWPNDVPGRRRGADERDSHGSQTIRDRQTGEPATARRIGHDDCVTIDEYRLMKNE